MTTRRTLDARISGCRKQLGLAGITRVIGLLDEKHKEEREYLINYLKDLLHGCLTFQRDDGLFFDVLTTLTALLKPIWRRCLPIPYIEA